MSGFPSSPLANRNAIRPASDILYNQQAQQHGSQDDSNKLGEQWIQDIEQYENMLEEMAAATLDQEFKDELSAIEQWFRVLSESERTAATYSLIQQTTQMQQRFFAQVLNQMSRSHPISGVLSPAAFGEKGKFDASILNLTRANYPQDAMSSRLSDAMSKLNVEGSRNSMGRPPPTPGNKRNSGLDPSTINSMFPDAAAAIAQKKAEYQQATGNAAPPNRNSAYGDRASYVGPPTISAPDERKESMKSQNWRQQSDSQPPISRPKSSSGQGQQQLPTPMGQFSQPPPSASLRSPRPMVAGSGNIQSTTLNAPEQTEHKLPVLSPYNIGNSSWASMSNTPMVPTFNAQQQQQSHNDMIANATAMKLAAMSTVNNRIALDDVKKYRRPRSNEPQGQSMVSPGMSNTGIPGANMIVVNDAGQILNAQQIAALQQQQFAAAAGRRSRPNSPGFPIQGATLNPLAFSSPQNNGFLSAYDSQALLNPGLTGMMPQMGQMGFSGHEGYLSDHSHMERSRSPRGRRGSSKPPEDPTDPALLGDISAWLRSLRLHKYTDNLKDMRWEDLVQLDDKGLEAKGVNALGARNKMLKVRLILYLMFRH